MKNKITFCLTLFTFTFLYNLAFSQEVCMVSADATTGQDYIVYWEQPADISNLDSVIIYRQLSLASGFFRIGALEVGVSSPTYFTDVNANTIAFSRYAIAFKDDNNVEGPLSLWHQPIVLDWNSNGTGELFWTKYQKENQVDESYIASYEYFIDETGTGSFITFGVVMNYETLMYDGNYGAHPNAQYYVQASLPVCNFQTKANINTSRSNIKQQYTNAEASINESNLNGVGFTILNNPATDNLTVEFKDNLKDATIWVSAMNGTQYNKSNLTGNEFKMSVSELSQGVYFFNVEVNGIISTKRFIKK